MYEAVSRLLLYFTKTNFHFNLVFQEAEMSIIILAKMLQGNFSIECLRETLYLLEIQLRKSVIL